MKLAADRHLYALPTDSRSRSHQRRSASVTLAATVVVGIALGAATHAAERRPPNIVLIMVDDLGWKDVHCYGNAKLDTPHIDALAAGGMRFTNAYAAAPVCSPTRAAVLTGLSPARLQITNHIPDSPRFTPKNAKLAPAKMLDHLPLHHTTVAEHLKAAGYATGFIGKWHLCGDWSRKNLGRGDPRYHPEKQGFDLNVGGCAMGGPGSFWDPYPIFNIPSRKKGEYLPDRLADESIRFIEKNREQPFLLVWWPYTVHFPFEAPADLVAKYEARKGGPIKNPTYAAMIEAMDRSVGRVLTALNRLKLSDNTLVIFTSDNGPFAGGADARPLRGAKGSLYDGGIRVPLVVRWPGNVKPGAVSDVPVVSMDLLPTILAAAGIEKKPDPLDGENLTPVLTGRGQLRREALYFHYPNYAWHRSNRLGGAIRAGDYKLIERFEDGSVELYNLREDIGERRNLAAQKPDLARRLVEQLRAWRKRVGAAMPRPR